MKKKYGFGGKKITFFLIEEFLYLLFVVFLNKLGTNLVSIYLTSFPDFNTLVFLFVSIVCVLFFSILKIIKLIQDKNFTYCRLFFYVFISIIWYFIYHNYF